MFVHAPEQGCILTDVASRALIYSWPLFRELWERRELLTKVLNFWKRSTLLYHSDCPKTYARLAQW